MIEDHLDPTITAAIEQRRVGRNHIAIARAMNAALRRVFCGDYTPKDVAAIRAIAHDWNKSIKQRVDELNAIQTRARYK